MRRKSRNKQRKAKDRTNYSAATFKEQDLQNDVSICEYADSSKTQKHGCSRVKKAVTSISYCIKFQRKDMDLDDKDVSWFDKDLDDFDVLDNAAEENSEEEDSAKIERKVRKKKCKETDDIKGRHVYPVDIWFTLAAYIHPEAVKNFAVLCKDSYFVTRTRQFWKNMYTRFCINNTDLPEQLQITCLERAQGLRYRVIRALYWSYPLFISRTTTNLPFENEPYHLKGNRCLFTWTEPFKNVWNFSFKLKKERLSHINKLTTLMALPGRVDLYGGYCDIYGHDEIDCYVLQVTCQNYQSFSSVMGLVLCNVYLKVSQESRFYCLRLHFDTAMKESTNQNRDVVGDTVITLDRVLNLKVFPWWHSKYPFN